MVACPWLQPSVRKPLKFKYKGFWSRRIDNEHRLIYRYKDDEILIAKCRFHYDG
jgi:toxin YoeB